MDLDVVFLGTAGSAPTARRNASCTLLRRGGERILLDCGEGAQRQLLQSSIGLIDLDIVLFSHYHGDHILGLPGLLKTYGLRGRERGLEIYGPTGLKALMSAFQPLIGSLPFPVRAREIEPGEAVPGNGYALEAAGATHRTPALCWALVENDRPGRFDIDVARALGIPEGPLFRQLQHGHDVTLDDGTIVEAAAVVRDPRRGRRVVFSGDTRPCDSVRAAATDADLLVHEATFVHEDRERANETGHSTASAAAALATEVGVNLLALTHLGGRSMPRVVKAEARALHANTVVPRDFDSIEIPFPERGDPIHVKAGAVADREEVSWSEEPNSSH